MKVRARGCSQIVDGLLTACSLFAQVSRDRCFCRAFLGDFSPLSRGSYAFHLPARVGSLWACGRRMDNLRISLLTTEVVLAGSG